MREIPLTKGRVALVDDADYEWLSQWKWHVSGSGFRWYANRKVAGSNVLMHRVIIDCPVGFVVDHKDGNRLNNCRANLRIATVAQNIQNQTKQLRNGKSIYKGAMFHKPTGQWFAVLDAKGKRYQGPFLKTAEQAAHAYDDLARFHHGEFARLNFPRDGEAAAIDSRVSYEQHKSGEFIWGYI